jgi:glucokinase
MEQGIPVIAFDVGGADIKAALFDVNGQMLGLTRTATPARGLATADAVIDQIEKTAQELSRLFPDIKPEAIGVVAPGLIDDSAGVGIHSANLHWDDVPFRDVISGRLALPASFSHDARAAGMAEFELGAARPFRNVVVVVIGTGVSAALIFEGVLYSGHGYAGELGHSIVDVLGEQCACGARGCLETVASAAAIARRYAALTGTDATGSKDVVARARGGDETALRVWDEALDALALSFSQLAAVLAPEAIVVGGGLAEAGAEFFEPLSDRLKSLLSFHRRPVLLPALLGENAGLIGAALMARRVCGAADSARLAL